MEPTAPTLATVVTTPPGVVLIILFVASGLFVYWFRSLFGVCATGMDAGVVRLCALT